MTESTPIVESWIVTVSDNNTREIIRVGLCQ